MEERFTHIAISLFLCVYCLYTCTYGWTFRSSVGPLGSSVRPMPPPPVPPVRRRGEWRCYQLYSVSCYNRSKRCLVRGGVARRRAAQRAGPSPRGTSTLIRPPTEGWRSCLPMPWTCTY